MKPSFWIKRFFVVFAGVFVVLIIAGLLRGRPIAGVATESAIWSGITSAVFVATRIYHSKRGRECALCGDTPGQDQNSKIQLGTPPLKLP
ncbi:MAG: hypothetical protein ABIZ04_23085 [Opitutus sp.]